MTASLRLQTLALMGQEFLSQALANGGSLDSAVADMLLAARPSSGKEKAATALTGKIRGDAASLRQGALNMTEGATMASQVKTATLSLGEMLSEMQTLVQSVASGQLAADATTQGTFKSLADGISSTISGTKYNGISLLDKDNWASDERLTREGDSAHLTLQAGAATSRFTIYDLSAMKDLGQIDLAAAYGTDPQMTAVLDSVAGHIQTANSMASGYGSLAGSYSSQAKQLERQADILVQAAARAVVGAANSSGAGSADESSDVEAAMKNILIDIVMRDQGKLVDTSS